jgi:Family of unknown function (DUF6364)
MKRQNLTLSADPQLIEAGREYARKHGKSLNQLFREYLASLTIPKGEHEFERFVELAKELKVNSGGYRFTRADAYDD